MSSTDNNTSDRTENSDSDRGLASQPAGYWLRLAYESVIAFIRDQQRSRGFTQPQFWLVRHLSAADLAADETGRTIPELTAAMVEYLRPEDDLTVEAAELIDRGLLSQDGDRLRITDAGEAARITWGQSAGPIRAQIHEGIDDADYVTMLKVLQRFIQNTRQQP